MAPPSRVVVGAPHHLDLGATSPVEAIGRRFAAARSPGHRFAPKTKGGLTLKPRLVRTPRTTHAGTSPKKPGSPARGVEGAPNSPACCGCDAMGFERVELRCPRDLDPRPSWTLGDVLAELDALDATRQAAPPTPLKQLPDWATDGNTREKAFVMRIDDEESTDDEDDSGDESAAHALVANGSRFSCNLLESSDSEESEDGSYHLMEKRNLEKSILLDLEREHHLKVQEEVRNKLAALEVSHQNEIQRTFSAFARLQKYVESRKEVDKRLDVHFQRRIAEVLDKHLSNVQRDHEQKSQIVERRIKDDAAIEEAKKKEQAIKEEKIRQERARQEAEARQKEAAKLAAEARKTAFEAARKEAAENEIKSREAAAMQSSQSSQGSVTGPTMANRNEVTPELPGIKVFAVSSALEAESRRRALFDQVPGNINLSKEFIKYDRQIAKSISKLMPTTDSVRARATELIKALDGQDCPRPIACRIFANKIISIVKSRNTKDKTFGNLAFACGYVMLLVTNQVPDAMEYLLAEFHRVCIYTVPKHLHALNAQARNQDYYKLIGYQEENGQLESTESYLTYVVAYMKLYAAMIQTEIKGVQHPHGLAEGWKWLAVFLNALPATPATAYALHAFLKMAGYALHKKYGSQFMKILDVISRCFLPALKEHGSKMKTEAVNNLQNYLTDKIYLEEPEGQYLAQQLLSIPTSLKLHPTLANCKRCGGITLQLLAGKLLSETSFAKMAAPPLSLTSRVAGVFTTPAVEHSCSRRSCFRPRLLPSKRWNGVVRMGAVVGGGQEGEDEEMRQAKEQAAARRRWEALIREQKIKTLTPREAGYTFKLTDKALLDVRPSNERQKAWVKGSTWIPVFDVDTSADLSGLSKKATNFVEEKFSKDTNIILVCQKGLRSLAACEQLYNAGFENLFWVQGGLEATEEEDFEREGPQPFKLAAIGGVSEFFGWTDQQRAQAAKEGLGYRLLFTGRLVGALVLLDALFFGAQRIGPLLQELQSH
ncbi:hypothetical protein EJB05_20990, partial [Eragrostis curvula]